MTQRPALTRALAHLRRRAAVGGGLPAVRALAAEAGVAASTLQAALRQLRSQGHVLVTKGRRTTVKAAPEAVAGGPVWRRLQQRIEADVLAGHFRRTGALPGNKELQRLYGGHHRTLGKAVDGLITSGVIVHHGRTRRLCSGVPFRSRRELLVFMYADGDELQFSYLDPHLLRHVEELCRQTEIVLTIIRVRRVDGEVSYTDHSSGQRWRRRRDEDVLGCLWIVLFPWQIIPDCCGALLALDVPVAVFGNPAIDTYPAHFVDSPRVRFFIDADLTRSGSDVGRYLLAAGHRRSVFVCGQFAWPWAKARCAGLERTFASAGRRDGLAAITADMPGRQPHTAFGGRHLARWSEAAVAGIGPFSRDIPRARLLATLADEATSSLGEALYRWSHVHVLEPLLERALAVEDATAWVCSDDQEALIAMAFLRRHGRRVPEDLAVLGFNNSPAALVANLSSYDFDNEAIFSAMFNSVVRPALLGRAQRLKVVETPGFLVPRRSSHRSGTGT